MASTNLTPSRSGKNASSSHVSGRDRRAAKKPSKPLLRSAAGGFLAAKSISVVSRQAFTEDGQLTPSAETWLTRAVTVQRPLVLANLRRLRKAHPTFTNRELAERLDAEFKRSMTGGGALIGATAAVPGVGTATSMGLSVLATGSFLELCALYAQSKAELAGISTEDPQKAKLLVMGIMLGEEGRQLLGELSAQVDGRGAGPIGSIVPLSNAAAGSAGASTMTQLIGNQLRKQFIRKFFIRRGTSMFARAIPFGIGAVIGGVGNRVLARQITSSAHSAFGEIPEQTPPALVEDFRRGLERERQRADRKKRRAKKRELKASTSTQRKELKQQRMRQKPDATAASDAPLPAEFTRD
ncbi:hypothetical protein FEF26_10615 [Nesterenkonia salmonea]|uniref:EcsC family protein n=1 Tax=Nesterenkonia salmonea TaxID=1804987 RepID=A0A5R9BBA9_9MICC|nr:hypothetical protein [Nesterenkonia salmonea]TLP95217.1 hypothetical protein FEF26_10615 [Nesterenkonia salmonea]